MLSSDYSIFFDRFTIVPDIQTVYYRISAEVAGQKPTGPVHPPLFLSVFGGYSPLPGTVAVHYLQKIGGVLRSL